MTENVYHVRTPTRLAAAAVLMATLAACGGGPAEPAAAPPAHEHGSAAPSDPTALPLRAGERFVELTTATPYTPEPPNGGTTSTGA
jgi:hypothetical protein